MDEDYGYGGGGGGGGAAGGGFVGAWLSRRARRFCSRRVLHLAARLRARRITGTLSLRALLPPVA